MEYNELTIRQESLNEIMDVNCYLVPEEEVSLANYNKVPITKLASLGAGLSTIPASLRTVTTTFSTPVANLYEETQGLALKKAAGDSGLLRGFAMNTDGINGQGLFKKVEGLNTTVTSTVPINPVTMCMAVALVAMDKKLDSILETEKSILNRMVASDRAKLRNNIDFLSEMTHDYRYNWNNERFLNNNHMAALTIKKEAGEEVRKYRELIEEKLKKKTLIQGDFSVKKVVSEVAADFKEYQLAVYLYSYASFVEVVLKGNFNEQYLNEIADRIEAASMRYRELFTEAYDYLESNADSMVETFVVDAFTSVGKALGKVAEKVPRLEQLEVDEALIDGANKLEQFNDQKVKKQLLTLANKQGAYVRPFIDNINAVNRSFNTEVEVLFDDEYVYLPKTE